MQIRIRRVPDGVEPREVRELLVGIKLPVKAMSVEPDYEIENGEMTIGGVEKKIFIISYKCFLDRVKKHNSDAYEYYAQPQVRFRYPNGIYFSKDCCKKQ